MELGLGGCLSAGPNVTQDQALRLTWMFFYTHRMASSSVEIVRLLSCPLSVSISLLLRKHLWTVWGNHITLPLCDIDVCSGTMWPLWGSLVPFLLSAPPDMNPLGGGISIWECEGLIDWCLGWQIFPSCQFCHAVWIYEVVGAVDLFTALSIMKLPEQQQHFLHLA